MTRYIFIMLCLLAIVSIVVFLYRKRGSKKLYEQQPVVKVSSLSAEDDAIKKYKEIAQEKIGYLIEFMGEHDRDDTLFRYFVKSQFSENGIDEHMWSQVHEFENGYFIGTLANDPAEIKNLKYNDKVSILKQDVEDWRLQDFLTNTQVGGYSTDYLHNTSEYRKRPGVPGSNPHR